MNDFDKTAYWKGRMNKTISRAFNDFMYLFKDVKSNLIHVGVDIKECEHALRLIGNGFEELKWIIDSVGEKKKNQAT
ncbi:MAG: hypothetical protein AAB706_02475 [Patescibacteria group bacterium]